MDAASASHSVPRSVPGGHALKVARQLAGSKSKRAADNVLSRSVNKFCQQLAKAGVAAEEVDRQRLDYLQMISRECARIGAEWTPDLDHIDGGHGGAA